MVAAGIGGALQLLGLLLNVFGAGLGAMAGGEEGIANMFSGGIGIVSNIIGMVMTAVVFLGATKMRSLQTYGFALASAIIAMIPCISPCCFIGLPVGIWALVILTKPEVKASFAP